MAGSMPHDAAIAHLFDETIPGLVMARDPGGRLLPVGADVVVRADGELRFALPPVRELFRGTRKPGDLSRGPTPELEPMFAFIEETVVHVCDAEGSDETDQQMERIYAALKRRPDGTGGCMHSYVRAAAGLYMSATDVSGAEYEAVMGRLAKSARTFSIAPISRNYLATLREAFPA
jgi:hypothetical protein